MPQGKPIEAGGTGICLSFSTFLPEANQMTYSLRLRFVTIPLTFLLLAGCTTEAWYKGVNQSSEHHCRKQPPGESQKCLDELNKTSYADYEKERAAQKQ